MTIDGEGDLRLVFTTGEDDRALRFGNFFIQFDGLGEFDLDP
jgi:hypothetical protein